MDQILVGIIFPLLAEVEEAKREAREPLVDRAAEAGSPAPPVPVLQAKETMAETRLLAPATLML